MPLGYVEQPRRPSIAPTLEVVTGIARDIEEWL